MNTLLSLGPILAFFFGMFLTTLAPTLLRRWRSSATVTTPTSTSGPEEAPPTRAELDRLRAENEALRKRADILSALGITLARVGRVTLFLIALAASLWFFWWCVRGLAFGDHARHNANQAATAHLRRLGYTSFTVSCTASTSNIDPNCEVRIGGESWPHYLHCDDDSPPDNDGCERVGDAR